MEYLDLKLSTPCFKVLVDLQDLEELRHLVSFVTGILLDGEDTGKTQVVTVLEACHVDLHIMNFMEVLATPTMITNVKASLESPVFQETTGNLRL